MYQWANWNDYLTKFESGDTRSLLFLIATKTCCGNQVSEHCGSTWYLPSVTVWICCFVIFPSDYLTKLSCLLFTVIQMKPFLLLKHGPVSVTI